MLDQFFNLIKEQMNNQPSEINTHMDDRMYNEAQNVVVNGLKNLDMSTIQSLTQAAQNNQLSNDNPQVQLFTQQFSSNITQKLGIDSNLAKTIAIAVIPLILKKLFSSSSNNNASSGFSLDGILGNILGGSSNNTGTSSQGGLMDKLSDIGKGLGLDKDGDGDVDLNDLTQIFKK